jgi:hypothetical protein
LIDVSLLVTIALIFFLTLLGAYLRFRARDRCLKAWEGFHITLERASGKLVWGVLHIESTGMELSYIDTVQDERHVESSYLLYAGEYPDIQALYRYEEKLSEWGKRERQKDIQRSFHPGPLRRLVRAAQNFLSTATDSLNEVFALLLGRAQKTGGRYLAADGGAALKNVGGKVLGQVGGVYDPLLEHYIGSRVVIELLEGDEVHEHVGIFKNYSSNFLEVLDIRYPQRHTLALGSDGGAAVAGLGLSQEGNLVRLINHHTWPVLVNSISVGEKEQLVNAVVDGGETIELHVEDGSEGEIKVQLRVVAELDMIVPRSRCVVRHRAENYRPGELSEAIFDLVFDVGRLFGEDDGRDTREARLRQELRRNPKDALAAANLGFLLIQKDELAEAEKWLRQATRMELSLPDGGRRVRMELREIERRRHQVRSYIPGVIQRHLDEMHKGVDLQ